MTSLTKIKGICKEIFSLPAMDKQDRGLKLPVEHSTINTAMSELSLEHLKSYDEWKPRWMKKNTFGPVIVDSHTWIDVSKVDIHAWVRTSPTAHINVNQHKAGYAYGSLHPEYNINDVNRLFGAALKRISQKILSYYEDHIKRARRACEASCGFAKEDGDQGVIEESEPGVDADHNDVELSDLSDLSSVSDSDEEMDESPNEVEVAATIASLCNWQPMFPIVNWRELRNMLIMGIWNTGYSHYKSWHEKLNKHDMQEATFNNQEYWDEGHLDWQKPRMTHSMTKRLHTDA
ncbi:hypothetical protein EV424DRAFT_1347049 [Suillus variegatus]|nr:hypothetical protein EV424DRAFT_1347049 [Suillus variegatus]